MKVAIVHDWLTGMRGGERCLEVLCELFPKADLYTLLHVPGTLSATIEKHPIRTSFIQRLPFASSQYRYYLPLFPQAIESFNLEGYDLILSSSHCVAKGVRVPKEACHVCYMYTPMRYIWDQYDAYFGQRQADLLTRMAMAMIRRRLQRWDVDSSDRAHFFIAISQHVARRIKQYYGKTATVVYPPVNWHSFQASEKDEGFYLMVTAFAPYKRVDLAIEAASRLGFPLKIIGSGQEVRKLKRLAKPNVEFLGWHSDTVIRDFYSSCRALIFPGEEDFGIVPLEAMATGKPVIAYGKGGVLETVVPLNPQSPSGNGPMASNLELLASSLDDPTGVFFYEQTGEALIEAIRLFERNRDRFHPQAIRAHVAPFDRARFKERMRDLITQRYETFRSGRPC